MKEMVWHYKPAAAEFLSWSNGAVCVCCDFSVLQYFEMILRLNSKTADSWLTRWLTLWTACPANRSAEHFEHAVYQEIFLYSYLSPKGKVSTRLFHFYCDRHMLLWCKETLLINTAYIRQMFKCFQHICLALYITYTPLPGIMIF